MKASKSTWANCKAPVFGLCMLLTLIVSFLLLEHARDTPLLLSHNQMTSHANATPIQTNEMRHSQDQMTSHSRESLIQTTELRNPYDKLIPASSHIWDGVHLAEMRKYNGSVLQSQNMQEKKLGGAFLPGLNPSERANLSILILAWDELCTRNNLTYTMYSGTLLGSYRHHGIVPWDDDIDFLMDIKDKPILRMAFDTQLPKEFSYYARGVRWKMYITEGPAIKSGISWTFPFVDISFYKRQGQMLVDDDVGYPKFIFPKSDIFPLKRRPLWDMWLPAPNHAKAVLSKSYKLDICVSNMYSHRMEDFTSQMLAIPCEKIKRFFPIVISTPLDKNRANESLVFDNKVVQWVIVPSN